MSKSAGSAGSAVRRNANTPTRSSPSSYSSPMNTSSSPNSFKSQSFKTASAGSTKSPSSPPLQPKMAWGPTPPKNVAKSIRAQAERAAKAVSIRAKAQSVANEVTQRAMAQRPETRFNNLNTKKIRAKAQSAANQVSQRVAQPPSRFNKPKIQRVIEEAERVAQPPSRFNIPKIQSVIVKARRANAGRTPKNVPMANAGRTPKNVPKTVGNRKVPTALSRLTVAKLKELTGMLPEDPDKKAPYYEKIMSMLPPNSSLMSLKNIKYHLEPKRTPIKSKSAVTTVKEGQRKVQTAQRKALVDSKRGLGGSWEAQLYNVLLNKIVISQRPYVDKKRDEIIKEIRRINVRKVDTIVKNVNQDITSKQYFDVLLLIWLDGIHDEYIKIGFENWYSTQVNSGIFNAEVNFDRTVDDQTLGGLFLYLNTYTKGQKLAELIRKGITEANIKFPAGWEKNIKDFLIDFYNYKKKNTRIFTTHITSPDKEGIALAVDQQYSQKQEQTLTKLIDGKNVVGLITMGQALDPGSTMLPGLITSELQTAVRSVINVNKQQKFKGQSKYALFGYEHILKVKGEPVFHLECTDKESPLPNLKFNGNTLKLTQTAGKAKKSNNTDQVGKISKYFGDAFQYLLFTNLSKKPTSRSNSGVVRHMFLGSGDSMMLLGFKTFCDIEDVDPHMIIDASLSNQPIIHAVNLPNGFQLETKSPIGVSDAGTNITRVNNGVPEIQSEKKNGIKPRRNNKP